MIQLFYFLLLSKGNEVSACNTCISFPCKQCSRSVNIESSTHILINEERIKSKTYLYLYKKVTLTCVIA